MKKLTLALGAAAMAVIGTMAGVAVAQQQAPRADRSTPPDPFGNATITRAEAESKAAALFARLDANKDGKLDQADRQAMRATRLSRRFDALDTNKDGKLDRAEFTAPRPAPQPGAAGSGMGGMGMGMGGAGRAHRLARMDGNADRAVSREEFVAGVLKRFDAADANKDGKLTPEERAAARRDRMGRGRLRGPYQPPNQPLNQPIPTPAP